MQGKEGKQIKEKDSKGSVSVQGTKNAWPQPPKQRMYL